MLSRGDQLPSDFVSNFIARPCALSDPNGLPHKGNKRKATDFFETDTKSLMSLFLHFQVVGYQTRSFLRVCFLYKLLRHQEFQHLSNILICSSVVLFTLIYVLVPWKCTFFLMAPPIQLSLQKKLNNKKGITHYLSITSMNVCQLNPKELCPHVDWRGKLLNCRKCKTSLCEFLSKGMIHLVPSNNQNFSPLEGF